MQNEGTIARVYSSRAGGTLFEQSLFVIWFLVIGLPIDAITPLRYLFILYFFSFFLLDSRNVFSSLARSWWLLPFAMVALLSFYWSPYASAALRSAVLMCISSLIIIISAARFTPRQIIRCVFISSIVLGLYIAVYPVPITDGGPWGSKNFAALHMLTAFIVSFVTALDRGETKQLRMLGALFTPFFAFLVISAQSTTALFMLFASFMMIGGLRVFFLDVRAVRNLFGFLLVFAFALGLAIIYAMLVFVDQQVIDTFLGAFGKDSSFTGRTSLWDEAENQISMRPWLGVGLEGFWQYDVGAAQTLNENDHKAFGTNLTFHNVHLEVMVHTGYVGYSMFFLAIFAVIIFNLKRLFSKPDMQVIGFCTVIVIGLISSFVESSLWAPFNIQAFLFFVGGAAYAQRPSRKLIGHLVIDNRDEQAVQV